MEPHSFTTPTMNAAKDNAKPIASFVNLNLRLNKLTTIVITKPIAPKRPIVAINVIMI